MAVHNLVTMRTSTGGVATLEGPQQPTTKAAAALGSTEAVSSAATLTARVITKRKQPRAGKKRPGSSISNASRTCLSPGRTTTGKPRARSKATAETATRVKEQASRAPTSTAGRGAAGAPPASASTAAAVPTRPRPRSGKTNSRVGFSGMVPLVEIRSCLYLGCSAEPKYGLANTAARPVYCFSHKKRDMELKESIAAVARNPAKKSRSGPSRLSNAFGTTPSADILLHKQAREEAKEEAKAAGGGRRARALSRRALEASGRTTGVGSPAPAVAGWRKVSPVALSAPPQQAAAHETASSVSMNERP